MNLTWLSNWWKQFNFNTFYVKAIEFIQQFSNIIYTLLQNILTTVAIPIGLFFVLAVEIPRVAAGISRFDEVAAHAFNAATVLVLSQMVFEFLIYNIEINAGWEEPKRYGLTWSNISNRWKYFWYGVGKENYEESPAKYYQNASSLNVFAILVLSTIGSLQEQIDALSEGNKPWHVALLELITNGNFKVLFIFVGGLLLAGALVYISTRYSRYVAVRAHQAFKEIQNRSVQAIQAALESRFVTLKEFIESTNSRVLNAIDLTKFTTDDKIEFIDDNRVRYHNQRTQLSSPIFDIGKVNARQKLIALILDEEKSR